MDFVVISKNLLLALFTDPISMLSHLARSFFFPSSFLPFFFETGFLCVAVAGTHFVDQVGLALTEIHLPLSPKYWD